MFTRSTLGLATTLLLITAACSGPAASDEGAVNTGELTPPARAASTWWDMAPGPRVNGIITTDAINVSGAQVNICVPCTDNNILSLNLLVTQVYNPAAGATALNPHHVGVGIDGKRVYVFNEDGAPMPLGASFNLRLDDGMQHVTAKPGSPTLISGGTDLGQLWFTTNAFNPGAGIGVNNNAEVAVFWNGANWGVVAPDRTAITPKASATVANYTGYVVTADITNTVGSYLYLNIPSINGNSSARVFVTDNTSPKGVKADGLAVPYGVTYDGKLKQWAIFTEDLSPMPMGASFNVTM
jgi:hypothetical protein